MEIDKRNFYEWMKSGQTRKNLMDACDVTIWHSMNGKKSQRTTLNRVNWTILHGWICPRKVVQIFEDDNTEYYFLNLYQTQLQITQIENAENNSSNPKIFIYVNQELPFQLHSIWQV